MVLFAAIAMSDINPGVYIYIIRHLIVQAGLGENVQERQKEIQDSRETK